MLKGNSIMRTQSGTQQDNLLAVVSHELRTTLNAISGWVRILRVAPSDNATTAQAFGAIEQNVKAQARLIEDLIDVSRLINGTFRLQMKEIDAIAVARAAAETLLPAAEEKGIRVWVVPLSNSAQVVADPFRLQQVIWNLLANAIKFTPHCGSVWVELERQGDDLEIKVMDTGKGIEADFLPHVFEKFRQGKDVISAGQGGLGLGLAIVREIIELHCGTVNAHSEGKGKGAIFTIRLPLQPPANDQVASLPQMMGRTSGTRNPDYSYLGQ
jgi:signal transduction histidine kinase